MSFVQGHLRREPISIAFESECSCCAEPIRFEIDEALRYRVEGDAEPLAFVPFVDFDTLEAPSIVDDF